MKRLLIVFLSVLMISCTGADPTMNWNGVQLTGVEQIIDGQSAVKKYQYDSDQKLVELEDGVMDRRIEVHYDNNRPLQLLTFDEEQLIFRDSVSYKINGQVDKIYKFSINGGEDLPLYTVYEYFYDEVGQPVTRKSLDKTSGEYGQVKSYTWNAGNVVKEETYNKEGELAIEYFFTYDDQVNYKKELPVFIEDPVYQSENNIVKTDWKGYTIAIDAVCQPCVNEYEYNQKGYPVYINTNWGKQVYLTYREKE